MCSPDPEMVKFIGMIEPYALHDQDNFIIFAVISKTIAGGGVSTDALGWEMR
jgi:hypothetical protein